MGFGSGGIPSPISPSSDGDPWVGSSTGVDPTTTTSTSGAGSSTGQGPTTSTTGTPGTSGGSGSGGPNDCLAEAGLTEEDLACAVAMDTGGSDTSGGASCECADPCDVRPPEDEVPCNFNYTQTCTIIDGITVCDNEYIPGEYQCLDFTNDFCQECTDAGVPTWTLTFGCIYRNYHWCLGYDPVFSHAAAIVEVAYPGPLRKFCVIEPQTNHEVVCWIDDEDPGDTLPGHVMTGLHNYYDAWGYQDCIDDGWTPYVDVY